METRIIRPEDITVFDEQEQSMIGKLQARITEALHSTRGDVVIMISNTPSRVVHEIARVHEDAGWNVYLTGRSGEYELAIKHPIVALPRSFEPIGDAVWVTPRGAIKYEGTNEPEASSTAP